MAKLPEFPDHTLEDALVKLDVSVSCLWQMKNPKHTPFAWLECLLIDSYSTCIIGTFRNGGWEVYSPIDHPQYAEKINDVLFRCRRKPQ